MWNFSETATTGYIVCAVRHKFVVCGTTGGLHAKNDFVHMEGHEACVVDGIGFMEFCEALDPRYRIPCCRSFKPLCAESATVRERQREGERKSACVRARGQALRSWPLVNLLIFV